MAFDAGAIVARADLDIKAWRRSVDAMKADTSSLRGFIMRNEDSIRRLGLSMSLVGAGMTLLLKSWAKEAINAVESENLFAVSLGKLEGLARAWSNSYSKTVGANAYETRKMLGTLQVMLTSMGVVEDQALGMSEKLTALINDMASFYNITVEEAFLKIQSGLTGEIEPLRRLGIIVDDTTAKHYALAHGITANWEQADQATKAYVRFQLIMERTTKAQGDLIRTYGSQANQLRRIQNEYDELKVTLMEGLMPALGDMLEDISGITEGLGAWAKMNPELASSIMLVTAAVTGLMVVLGPLLLALPTLAKLPWGSIAKLAGYAAMLSMKGNAPGANEEAFRRATLSRLAELDRLASSLESAPGLAPSHGAPAPAPSHVPAGIGVVEAKLREINEERALLWGMLNQQVAADAANIAAWSQGAPGRPGKPPAPAGTGGGRAGARRTEAEALGPPPEEAWRDFIPRVELLPWEDVEPYLADILREEESFQDQLVEDRETWLAEISERVREIDAEIADSRESAWQKAFDSFVKTEDVERYRRFMWEVTAGWQGAIGSFLDDMVRDFDFSLDKIGDLFGDLFDAVLRAWIDMAATMAAEKLFTIMAPKFGEAFSFASGGRVERPTLAVIGDDARGPERVLSGPENAAYERALGRPARVSVEIRNETGVAMEATATASQADAENLVIGIVARRITHDRSFRDLVRGGR